MAELVIVGLELIDIQHHKTHRETMPARTLDFFQQALFDVTAVQEAGQSVSDRKLFELACFFLERRPVDSDRKLWSDGLDQFQSILVKRLAPDAVREIHNADRSASD